MNNESDETSRSDSFDIAQVLSLRGITDGPQNFIGADINTAPEEEVHNLFGDQLDTCGSDLVDETMDAEISEQLINVARDRSDGTNTLHDGAGENSEDSEEDIDSNAITVFRAQVPNQVEVAPECFLRLERRRDLLILRRMQGSLNESGRMHLENLETILYETRRRNNGVSLSQPSGRVNASTSGAVGWLPVQQLDITSSDWTREDCGSRIKSKPLAIFPTPIVSFVGSNGGNSVSRKRPAPDHNAGEPPPRQRRKPITLATEKSRTFQTITPPRMAEGLSTQDFNYRAAKPRGKATSDDELDRKFASYLSQIPASYDTRHAATQSADIAQAEKDLAGVKVETVPGGWTIDGMSCTISGYQLTAAGWMIRRERSGAQPSGGLLADVPGTGKTIMSLLCIVGNPPSREDMNKYRGTTLVITPNMQVAEQWYDEIGNHCDRDIHNKTVIYSGKKGSSLRHLRDSMIIITTHATVKGQYPSKTELCRLRSRYEHDATGFNKKLINSLGDVFQKTWYRVIVDEAHDMKSVSSKTSRAFTSLRAKTYWALTGTPFANKVDEFYPYMKFIGCEFTDTLTNFKANYVRAPESKQNFEVVASLLMHRRTLSDTFLNSPILDLPPLTQHEVWVPLFKGEAIIDQCIDDFISSVVAEAMEAKRKGVKPAVSPASLNRQRYQGRQLGASHLFNLEKYFRTKVPLGWLKKMRQRLLLVPDCRGPGFLQQIQRGENDSSIKPFATGLRILNQRMPQVFQSNESLDKILELTINERLMLELTCSMCRRCPPKAPVKSKECKHVYCTECMLKQRDTVSAFDQSPKCVHDGCQERLRVGPLFSTLRGVECEANIIKEKTKALGQDRNKINFPHRPGQSEWYNSQLTEMDMHIVPGAKVTAAMSVALTWLDKAPQDKIIIFAQFVTTGRVLGRLLTLAGVEFLYFYGHMSDRQRANALKDFKEDPNATVLLVHFVLEVSR